MFSIIVRKLRQTTYIKTVVNFFSPSEISEAKGKVIGFFDVYLTDCPLKVTRRQSQLRSAHDAETEDIGEMFNLLDNHGVPGAYQFAAVNLDRLPKDGFEEPNICSIAYRQSHLDYDVKVIAQSVTDAQLSVKCINQLELHMATLLEHVNTLSAVCAKVSSFSDILQRSGATTPIGVPQ
jgi:hypothetical protein